MRVTAEKIFGSLIGLTGSAALFCAGWALADRLEPKSPPAPVAGLSVAAPQVDHPAGQWQQAASQVQSIKPNRVNPNILQISYVPQQPAMDVFSPVSTEPLIELTPGQLIYLKPAFGDNSARQLSVCLSYQLGQPALMKMQGGGAERSVEALTRQMGERIGIAAIIPPSFVIKESGFKYNLTIQHKWVGTITLNPGEPARDFTRNRQIPPDGPLMARVLPAVDGCSERLTHPERPVTVKQLLASWRGKAL